MNVEIEGAFERLRRFLGDRDGAEAPVGEEDGFVGFEGQDALFAAGYCVRHAEGLGGEGWGREGGHGGGGGWDW